MSRRIAFVLLLFFFGTACGSDSSGGIDWDALGATYRDSMGPVTTPAEAARVIGAMIGG